MPSCRNTTGHLFGAAEAGAGGGVVGAQMVQEHFPGAGEQHRLTRELSRVDSEHLSLATRNRSGSSVDGEDTRKGPPAGDDLAALSLSWASPELMPEPSCDQDRCRHPPSPRLRCHGARRHAPIALVTALH